MFNLTDQLSPVSHRTYLDQQIQLSPEQLREKLRKQLEYYFSKENMIHDVYLQSQMDADNYVPISLIANFKLVKRLTPDLQLIIDVLKESPLLEVDVEKNRVRSSDDLSYLPIRKRCTIILRNIPLDAIESEILELFSNEFCSASAIGCERVLESNNSDCWYVTFNSEEDAQNAFLYLTRDNVSIRGQKVLARMKGCLWQKSHSTIPQNSSPVLTQESYNPVYIQSMPINQTSFRGNLSQQQANAFKSRQIQLLQQYLPLNYNTNLSSHQQNPQSTLLFATNMQSLPINYYQQAQYINRNHSVLPVNFWYISPTTADSYSPMAYNIQSKSRITNNSKARNSTKSMSNHSNELVNSCQNSSISHSENPTDQTVSLASTASTIDDSQNTTHQHN